MRGNRRVGTTTGGPASVTTGPRAELRGWGRGRVGSAPAPGSATDPGGRGAVAGPPSIPPGRPTHLRGLQPHPHLPHQEGLQAAARGAEEAGARCRPRCGTSGPRRHGGCGAASRSGSRGLGRARTRAGLDGRVELKAEGAREGRATWAWPQLSHWVNRSGPPGFGIWNDLESHVEEI